MAIPFRSWLPAALVLGACASPGGSTGEGADAAPTDDHAGAADLLSPPSPTPERTDSMQLGSFCVCLAVKDLAASRAFYEKLDFTQVAGDAAQGWLVLKNDTTKIGLFAQFIEKTTLTFNPGWSVDGQPLADFTDVRDLQRMLEERGVTPEVPADPSDTGPGFFILNDPDGNPIYVDQHVPRPGR